MTEVAHPDLTETGGPTREWYLRLTPMQKTSDEMSDDEVDGADWQDGYDTMVRAARIQHEVIERLRVALENIARDRGGFMGEYHADCQQIAQEALTD